MCHEFINDSSFYDFLYQVDLDIASKVQSKPCQYCDGNSSNPERPFILSASQKVELFKVLFKGRSDVFAHRWENTKGRSGYSFSCENEWKKGLCHKPKVKGNQCSNRKYKPLGDQAC